MRIVIFNVELLIPYWSAIVAHFYVSLRRGGVFLFFFFFQHSVKEESDLIELKWKLGRKIHDFFIKQLCFWLSGTGHGLTRLTNNQLSLCYDKAQVSKRGVHGRPISATVPLISK